MESYVVISAYPNQFWNDYEKLEYFEDIEIIAVYKTLKEALDFISSKNESLGAVKQVEIQGKGLELGLCWNIGHYYIVKR